MLLLIGQCFFCFLSLLRPGGHFFPPVFLILAFPIILVILFCFPPLFLLVRSSILVLIAFYVRVQSKICFSKSALVIILFFSLFVVVVAPSFEGERNRQPGEARGEQTLQESRARPGRRVQEHAAPQKEKVRSPGGR